MLKGSKVLVTGGAGHVGSHIVDRLIEGGVREVIVYDDLSSGKLCNLRRHINYPSRGKITYALEDIRDKDKLLYWTKECDYVFHTASLLLLESQFNPEKAIDVNIKGTYNVIKSCVENKVKKVIFSSSASVYGDPFYIPVDEEHPYNSEIIYGTTKIAGEHLFKDFHKSHGLNFVGLRYYNIYGPRIHLKGSYTQVIPRWFDLIEKKEPITINGNGSQTMDLIYVDDVARANILALESYCTHDFFNVGTGIATTVSDLANIIMNTIGYKVPVIYSSTDINLVRRRQCSTRLAKEKLGFVSEVSVKEGIERYYEWRRSNGN